MKPAALRAGIINWGTRMRVTTAKAEKQVRTIGHLTIHLRHSVTSRWVYMSLGLFIVK